MLQPSNALREFPPLKSERVNSSTPAFRTRPNTRVYNLSQPSRLRKKKDEAASLSEPCGGSEITFLDFCGRFYYAYVPMQRLLKV